MFGKRFSRALAVTATASLIMATAAFADELLVDGDALAPYGSTLAFGSVNCGEAATLDARLAIQRTTNGSPNIFEDGSTASISVFSASAALSAVMPAPPANQITFPAGWESTANNIGATTGLVTSAVTVNSSTPGPGSGTVVFRATGTAANNTALVRDATLTVTWTTGSCAPANSAPTLASPGNQTVAEGSTLSLSLSASDPQNQTLTYSMAGHRTGTADDMALNPSTGEFLWSPVDNYADYTVTFRATDTGGLHDEKTITISSTNVAPTGTLGHNGPKAEGSAVTVSFSGVTDPSSADTSAGFTYAFACDGSTFAAASSSASASCTFGDNGSPAIKGRVIDKDGGSTEYTVNPSITNVAPDKTSSSFTFNSYTGVADASVSFSDPGWLDIVTANFSGITNPLTTTAGPGSSPGPLTGTFSTSQTFTGCVTDAISVRVSDDDGGYFEHEFAAADTLGVRTAAFKAPIKEGTKNIVKLGNVIPTKLTVLDCHGNPVQGLTLSIRLVRGDVTGEPEIGAVVVDATSVSSADSTNVMRYQDDGFYMYNLGTKGLTTGIPFTIQVRDGTQIIATALIEAKK